MGSMARPALCVLVTVLVLATAVQAAFDGYDGMPRPSGMDQSPTSTYGPKPAVKYLNKPANCIWYGWENGNYPPEGTKNCSTALWASLSHANAADLQGFLYYAPQDGIYYDPTYNEYLCAIGCFDLTASSGPASPPSGNPGDAPTVPEPSAVPPTVPPSADTTPPPGTSIVPPPPATLFRPPPPALPLAPAIVPVASEPTLPPSTPPITTPSTPPTTAPSTPPTTAPPTPLATAPVKPPSPGASVPTAPSPQSSPGAQAPGPSTGGQTGAASITSASILLLLASILVSLLV